MRLAHQATLRAKARERQARYVLRETRRYSRIYGSAVGRWVRLALRSGWKRSQLSDLMRVMFLESRGDPAQVNDSKHAGLLQEAWEWYRGVWWKHVYDPLSARATLFFGFLIWRDHGGWKNWVTATIYPGDVKAP